MTRRAAHLIGRSLQENTVVRASWDTETDIALSLSSSRREDAGASVRHVGDGWRVTLLGSPVARGFSITRVYQDESGAVALDFTNNTDEPIDLRLLVKKTGKEEIRDGVRVAVHRIVVSASNGYLHASDETMRIPVIVGEPTITLTPIH